MENQFPNNAKLSKSEIDAIEFSMELSSEVPATSADTCSRRCGGDQNVSRPIVRCHEMSQISPTTMPSEAPRTAYSGHIAAVIRPAGAATDWIGAVVEVTAEALRSVKGAA